MRLAGVKLVKLVRAVHLEELLGLGIANFHLTLRQRLPPTQVPALPVLAMVLMVMVVMVDITWFNGLGIG